MKHLSFIFIGFAFFSMTGFSGQDSVLKNSGDTDITDLSRIRIQHARELLGHEHLRYTLFRTESSEDIDAFVRASTKKFLKKRDEKKAPQIADAMIKASVQYSFDPMFLMALILNESSFNPRMKGSAGEIGLMQVLPATAEWIAKKYHIAYRGAKTLYDPAINIKIGSAALDQLRQQFDSESRLYVSAYNIGARKVRSMVSDNNAPKEYVQAVMKRYLALYRGFKASGNMQERINLAWVSTVKVTQAKEID